MAPKSGDTAAAKETVKVKSKTGAAPKWGVVAGPVRAARQMEAMDPGALKQMTSYMSYHGVQKQHPDEFARKLLDKFSAASAAEKRKLLEGFKFPNGKSLKWCKDMVTSETKTDKLETGQISDYYTRIEFKTLVVASKC